MKKISVKNIVAFRRKSDKFKKVFLKSISKQKKADDDGGGNYWIRSLSAINNAFKNNDNQYIKEKIEDILDAQNKTNLKQSKDMYQRNLDILYKFEDFNFSTWHPNKTFKIVEKINKQSIFEIDKVPVQVALNQVFTFTKSNINYVGGIWFIAKLNGFTKEELGIFTEVMYKYLKNIVSKKHEVSPENCIVVDVLNLDEYSYKMVLDGKIQSILKETLKSIRDNL